MKKFNFPLTQVLNWRRTVTRLEEARLEGLHAELLGIEARALRIREEQAQSESALLTGMAVTGAELVALDSFNKWVAAECQRLARAVAACQGRIATQMEVVVQKRRDVRLIEKLHDRKLAIWKADIARETDQQAEELHLGKIAAQVQRGRG